MFFFEKRKSLNRLISSLQQEIEPSTLNNIATACQGLSLERIRRVLSKVIAKYGEIDASSPNLILQEKKRRKIGFPHIAFLILAGLICRSRVRALKNSWPKQLVPENLAVRHAGETSS